MQISKRLFIICLLFVVAFSGLNWVKVSAQDSVLDSQQIENIRTNCSSIKNTLSQLYASDALLRVNMGQIYESMSTKLMAGFTGRVSNNHYNNSDLKSISKSYDSMLDKFRSDYKIYDNHLSSAINIDCSKNQTSFYNAVADTRTEREHVHSDISNLNQLIDQYQAAVGQFEKDYQDASSGVRN
jgi:hypothetical protein